jgi:hypothetical protein
MFDGAVFSTTSRSTVASALMAAQSPFVSSFQMGSIGLYDDGGTLAAFPSARVFFLGTLLHDRVYLRKLTWLDCDPDSQTPGRLWRLLQSLDAQLGAATFARWEESHHGWTDAQAADNWRVLPVADIATRRVVHCDRRLRDHSPIRLKSPPCGACSWTDKHCPLADTRLRRRSPA